jgi:hypothetical protein
VSDLPGPGGARRLRRGSRGGGRHGTRRAAPTRSESAYGRYEKLQRNCGQFHFMTDFVNSLLVRDSEAKLAENGRRCEVV